MNVVVGKTTKGLGKSDDITSKKTEKVESRENQNSRTSKPKRLVISGLFTNPPFKKKKG